MYCIAIIRFNYFDCMKTLAAKISEVLFGGINFDEPINRDEAPAICLKPDLLGFCIVLMQEKRHSFCLEITPVDCIVPKNWQPRLEDFLPCQNETDISEHFAHYLSKISGVKNIRCGIWGDSLYKPESELQS